MSYREDFMRMLEGKTPVSDVMYNRMSAYAVEGEVPGVVSIMSSYGGGRGALDAEGKNMWGIPQEIDVYGTGYMPAPGQFILTDVTKWRDVVKAPYIHDFDWAAAVERDLANFSFDPETQVTSLGGAGGGYFLQLSFFMGFEGAMFAMYDAPDAVHELLDYLCDYDLWFIDKLLTYYPDADIMGMGDDNATELNPFISYEFFKEFLYPRYKRVADRLKEAGKIISYHNCGRCEDFMDDMVDMGVQVWNCATPVNDLNAFKAKHDNKIILEVMPRLYPHDDEATTRRVVRETIDAYAPGGAFIWIGGSSTMNTEIGGQVDEWAYDEVKKYGKGFYSK